MIVQKEQSFECDLFLEDLLNEGNIFLVGLVLGHGYVQQEVDVFGVVFAGFRVDRFQILYYFGNGGLHYGYVGLSNQAVVGFVQHDQKFSLPHFQRPSYFLYNFYVLSDNFGVLEAFVAEVVEKLKTLCEGMSLFSRQLTHIF